MTKPTEAQIANGKAEVLQSMREHAERLQAMPDEGHVLYNPLSHLAMNFPDAGAFTGFGGRVGGLPWAKVFQTSELRDRHHPARVNRYRDGAGHDFRLMPLAEAKALALEENAKAIALIDQYVADQIAALAE